MKRLLVLLLALLAATPALAHSYKAGQILIGHPWVLPTPTTVSEIYLSLLNQAPLPDQLIAVTVPSGQAAVIVNAQGQRMQALDLPPGKPVLLKPGGIRIVVGGLDKQLRVGDRLKITLIFARAGSVLAEAMVEANPSHS
jgi:copper(I)-binding protein